MPRPRSRVPSQVSVNGGNSRGSSPFNAPDPSMWSEEQQAQFLQALMGGPPPAFANGPDATPENPFTGIEGNPLAALMAGGAGAGFPPFGRSRYGNEHGHGQDSGCGASQNASPTPSPRAAFSRSVGVGGVFCLVSRAALLCRALWGNRRHAGVGRCMALEATCGRKWTSRMGSSGSGASSILALALAETLQPFFWGFATVQLVLHSLRIFSGFVSLDNGAVFFL
ncbi:hypothetical protein FB45DRAFT_532314 [Roridomyces roridus]|uniref:Uncharacterized protein n=1 Tax=Roridomyces roridus TaxID=1738132 RepID=A0AAD7BTL1_9AGAR|nr:hypothetical protein FB45DRAFT_532314 [Roridomyces roridus]